MTFHEVYPLLILAIPECTYTYLQIALHTPGADPDNVKRGFRQKRVFHKKMINFGLNFGNFLRDFKKFTNKRRISIPGIPHPRIRQCTQRHG